MRQKIHRCEPLNGRVITAFAAVPQRASAAQFERSPEREQLMGKAEHAPSVSGLQLVFELLAVLATA